jgi:hypothetical protein
MKYLTWTLAALGGLVLMAFVGLSVKPGQFPAPATPATPKPVRLVPIPAGLPAPVDRWFRAEFPAGLPVYDTVVMQGTGIMRIAGIGLPFRHRVELRPGRGFYRKMDLTWFNIAFLHGLDTCIDGVGVMNTPVGPASGPKVDQAANIVSWLELLPVPGVLAENPRVRWEPIDAGSARLVVPYEDGEDSLVVGFDPVSGEPTSARTSRYRATDSADKTGWVAMMSDRKQLPGGMGKVASKMDVQWDGDTKPWATFEYQAAWPNAEVPGFDSASSAGGVKIGAAR